MPQIADLIDNEINGTAEFFVDSDNSAFDPDIKEVPLLYKLLGDSRFRLVRNNKFELVFIQLTEDWMRQAKIDLNKISYEKGLNIKLAWDKEQNSLSVKSVGDPEYITSLAVQIE